MRKTEISFPELGLIAGTRGILGAGLGLLLGGRLNESQRKAVGWTLSWSEPSARYPWHCKCSENNVRRMHDAREPDVRRKNSVHRNRVAH